MAERNAGMTAAALVCGLIVVGLLLSMLVAGTIAASPTPVQNVSTPTPVPTPESRTVLTAAGWDSDHAYVQVTNNGPDIDVDAFIGSLSDKTSTHVKSGVTTKVPTMSVNAQPGQIIRCWFKAYQNGTLIDSMEVPITVTSGTPTPPPATASLTGIVTDTSSNPVTGAEVTFEAATWGNEYTVVTDASGQYRVPAMVPDTYKITITAGGYQTYRAMTDGVIRNVQQMSLIVLQKLPSGVTPTPTPAPTPSATPGSPMDAWLNLLYSPQACCGTLAVGLGAIVSATAIYEWTMRQRERRKREAAEFKKESKDSKESK